MNAQSIWSGEEYAYSTYRPNKTFVMNARKGRCIRTFKQREFGNERMSNYVEFTRIDEETGEELGTVNVRARDVIDFWDNYINERAALRKKREEQQKEAEAQREKWRQEREERMRKEAEEREAIARREQEQKDRLIRTLAERTGIPREAIRIYSDGAILLDRPMMEVWLTAHVSGD